MAQRHDNSDSLSETLDALKESFAQEEPQQKWGTQLLSVGLLAAIVVLIAWLGQSESRNASVVIAHRAIDVADLATDRAWVGTALHRGTQAFLLSTERVRLVNDHFTTSNPASVAGVDWVLTGELKPGVQRDDQIQLEIRLRDQLTGSEYSATITGSQGMLSELALRAAQQTQSWLGLEPLSLVQVAQARAEFPVDEQARQLYAQGLSELARYDGRAALQYFESAATLAPGHALIHDAQAEAWAGLGYRHRANEQAEMAVELKLGLSRERQLAIEARHYLIQSDWQRAQDKYRALWEFFPNDVGYGLALVSAQQGGARYTEALDTIQALRQLPPPYRDDPRIDLSQGRVHYQQGDWVAGRPVVEAALVKARSAGATAILAQALQLAAMMDAPDADNYLSESGALFESLGNMTGRANVLNTRGRRAFAAGHLSVSANHYRNAVNIAQSIGDEATEATALNNLAIYHDLFGELETGLKLKHKILENYRRRGVQRGIGVMLENIGISLFKLGKLKESQSSFDRALEQFYRVSDQIGLAWAPYHRGRNQSRLGQLNAARESITQAINNAQDRPEGQLQLHSRFELARIEMFNGNLPAAEELARAVLAGYQDSRLRLDAAETQVVLARILRSQGVTSEPNELVQEALAVFAEEKASYYELNAVIEQFDQLSKSAEAADALTPVCERLETLTADQEHGRAKLRAKIRLALCLQQHDPVPEKSVQILRETQAEARRLGLFEPEFEATELLKVLRPEQLGITQVEMDQTQRRRDRGGWKLGPGWSL